MSRPTGVTLIALLDFLGTLFMLCLGVVGFVAANLLVGFVRSSSGMEIPAGIGAAVGILLAVFCFFFAALAAAIGWGIWNLKEWARIVQMVFAALGTLGAAAGVMFSMTHFHVIGIGFSMVRLAINLLILWYLNQPHVKAAFAAPIARAATN